MSHAKSILKVVVNGATGRMGINVVKVVINDHSCELAACVASSSNKLLNKPYDLVKSTTPLPIVKSILDIKADVIIDFSTPVAVMQIIQSAVKMEIPLVIGTTGFNSSQSKELKFASTKIPVFISSNMSSSVFLFGFLAKFAANLFQIGKIEIVEEHHRFKKDKPSGTALLLKDQIKQVFKTNDIPIHSVRVGDIIGNHSIKLGLRNEVITLSHSALSRELFALGSLDAAKFLVKQKNGIYEMSDMINSQIQRSMRYIMHGITQRKK